MINYIRAELYKVFRRKYTWITLAVTLLLETLLASGWVYTNINGNHVDFYTGAGMLCVMLVVGFYALMITCDMVFADQYKQGTLKNEVAFGLPRGRIYLGKFVAGLMVSLLFMLVMLGYYLGLCYLALYRDPELDIVGIRMVGYCLATALPLWIGVLACVCAFRFLVKSELVASIAAVSIFALSTPVLEICLALFSATPAGTVLQFVHSYMPIVMVTNAPSIVGDWICCGQAWIVGAIWLVGFTAIGLANFRRKEIR